MKCRHIISLLAAALLLLLVTTGCDRSHNFALGFSPGNGPITLTVDAKGRPHVILGARMCTPIGSFSLSYPEADLSQHSTRIHLVDRLGGEDYYWELLADGEKIQWKNNRCDIQITNEAYRTTITVQSDEISNLIHEKDVPGYKPHFPSQPFVNFVLTKKFQYSQNWEIHRVSDFIADVFFGFVWILCVMLDISLMVIMFFLRLCWWFILLIGYMVGIR